MSIGEKPAKKMQNMLGVVTGRRKRKTKKCSGRARRDSDKTKESFRKSCKTLDGKKNVKSFRKARKNSGQTKNILEGLEKGRLLFF